MAKDEAFCFYYRENLELLAGPGGGAGSLFSFAGPEASRRESQVFSWEAAIRSSTPGGSGGKPSSRRRDPERPSDAALPTVAECGGYLYLHTALEDQEGGLHSMAGVLPGKAWYTGKLRRFGYLTLKARRESLYGPAGTELRGP